MKTIPGGVWLEPSDLGFNAAAIAAAGNLNGLIIPWCAAYHFRRICFTLRQTGPASSVNLRLNQELDFDGVTVLRSGISGIWSTITDGGMFAYDQVSTAGVPLVSVGAPLANPMASFWTTPYVQFNILNNDGLNAANVTLRVGLFE